MASRRNGRRYLRNAARRSRALGEHYWARWRARGALCGSAHFDTLAHLLNRPNHHREGLVIALFSASQTTRRGVVIGADGQMKSAQPLDGDDLSLQQHSPTDFDRIAGGLPPFGVDQLHLRPALMTCDRLSMKASIRRRCELLSTGRAHCKAGHGRIAPVIRNAPNDRETRAALSAVRQRVSAPTLAGRKNFSHAIGTCGRVDHDVRTGARAGVTAENAKRGIIRKRRHQLLFNRADYGRGWMLLVQRALKLAQRNHVALTLNHDSIAVVSDKATEPQLAGDPVNKGSKANPLDLTSDKPTATGELETNFEEHQCTHKKDKLVL
jgi:hypothetical protein